MELENKAFVTGLAIVDIAYLFFVSFECYFVLHGTLWHESPVVPLETNEYENRNKFIMEWKRHSDILLPNSSSKLQETNPFNFYPIEAYPWSKYQLKVCNMYLLNKTTQNVLLN